MKDFLLRKTNLLCLAFAISISSIAICSEATGSRFPSEFVEFKSICSVVSVRGDPRFQSALNWEALNKSVAGSIEARLREKGFDFPVAYGNQCYPGNLARSPKVLGLLFHVTVADGPTSQSAAIAVIVHSFSQSTQMTLHDHPTAIKFCNLDDLSSCLADRLAGYAEDNVVKVIERVQTRIKADQR